VKATKSNNKYSKLKLISEEELGRNYSFCLKRLTLSDNTQVFQLDSFNNRISAALTPFEMEDLVKLLNEGNIKNQFIKEK